MYTCFFLLKSVTGYELFKTEPDPIVVAPRPNGRLKKLSYCRQRNTLTWTKGKANSDRSVGDR